MERDMSEAREAEPVASGRGKTILIVDDEDGVRESIREILSDEGYSVVEAADGRQALERIGEARPALVLLDVWMPDQDGIAVLKEIKEREPELAVVMISGHGNIHTAVAATKLGAFDFVEKPLSLEGLLATVRRALGESRGAERGRATAPGRPARTASRHGGAAMPERQRTLKKSVVVAGQGLHSGLKTGLILHPLPPGSGIVFSGISADATVPAHLDYVRSTGYATSLEARGFVVGTVEHFLAAAHAYRVSNLLVKVQGEVPILDGSALEFCQLIEEAGVEEQDAWLPEIVIDRTYRVQLEKEEFVEIEPADRFSVHYVLVYPRPVGRQEYTYVYRGPESFKAEIAPARTFGFLREIEKLQAMGLVNGGKLNNCILIDDEKIINTDLRFPDELARHKILDLIGDLYLLGRPIRGRVTAHMTGHKDNIALLKQIQAGLLEEAADG
jgi:UDP-3-O-[3-hydroxymyristoyl] N-acetylglucosamine deacetylase